MFCIHDRKRYEREILASGCGYIARNTRDRAFGGTPGWSKSYFLIISVKINSFLSFEKRLNSFSLLAAGHMWLFPYQNNTAIVKSLMVCNLQNILFELC